MESRMSCLWIYSGEENDYWKSECGKLTCINNGTPHENRWIFCPYCGGIIREKAK